MRKQGIKDSVAMYGLNFISRFYSKKRIVFESGPEFSCNTYPVYRYLIDNKHIDKDTEIIWVVRDKSRYTDGIPKNHRYIEVRDRFSPLSQKLPYFACLARAEVLVYSNHLLGKYSDKQYSVCLMHGMPLKRTQEVYSIDDECDIVISTGEIFDDMLISGFGVSRDKLLHSDFPRCEYLFGTKDALSLLGLSGFSKVIIWMPTFRKTGLQRQYDMAVSQTGLPLLGSPDDLKSADKALSLLDILLLIKPHPVEETHYNCDGCKNIRIVTDEQLRNAGLQTNELLACSDALVTDYSTVYYDYLLTGRPIALSDDDAEEYEKKRGFYCDKIKNLLVGERLSGPDDLIVFAGKVLEGKDDLKEQREEVSKLIHPYYKPGITAEIGELIYNKLKQ